MDFNSDKLPANLKKIKVFSKKKMRFIKHVNVTKLSTQSRAVSKCFHPVSRIIE